VPLIISGFVFTLLVAIGQAIATNIDQSIVVRRMEQLGETQAPEPILAPELTKSWIQRIVTPMLSKVSEWIGSLAPGTVVRASRRRLERAGHPWSLTADSLVTVRLVSAITAMLLSAVILRNAALGGALNSLLAIIVTGAGILGPAYLIDRIADKRCRQIKKSLPNVIDLLVVGVEAGLGLDGAIAEIIQRETGPLSDEFQYALTEIRLGKRRRDAWRNLASRAQVRDLSAFMAALCQAEELGASISKVLRSHSETLRIKRSIQVRELANKIPVKMLFPLVFCIFPSMFIVILGPGAISIMHSMGKLGG